MNQKEILEGLVLFYVSLKNAGIARVTGSPTERHHLESARRWAELLIREAPQFFCDEYEKSFYSVRPMVQPGRPIFTLAEEKKMEELWEISRSPRP